jgi:hypothetical protein
LTTFATVTTFLTGVVVAHRPTLMRADVVAALAYGLSEHPKLYHAAKLSTGSDLSAKGRGRASADH